MKASSGILCGASRILLVCGLLIVASHAVVGALHGLGGTHETMMRGNVLDLAEAGGHILVAEATGGNQRSVISIGMPTIFEFFGANSRPAPR